MLQETTPLPKKSPGKVRGRARCFRQVNKTKIFLFPATLPDRLHTDTNINNKNFQQQPKT